MENGEQPSVKTHSEQELPMPPNEQNADYDEQPSTANSAAGEDIAGLLQDARNKADEHWNQLLRVRAEMENLRRRNERELENAHKYALERFALELLPVKDSLELGLAAISDAGGASMDALNKLQEGTQLTYKMLQAALEKFGLKEINPAGEKFNPEFHQAMTLQEAANVEPNTVMAVCQKGYLLHDRLIRPAMVIVAKAPEAPVT